MSNRNLILAGLVVIALGWGAWTIMTVPVDDAAPQGLSLTSPESHPALAAELADLQHRLSRIEARLDEVSRAQARSAIATRSFAEPQRTAATPSDPTQPAAVDLASYLEQYVRSFDGGGTGSEFFRLLVDAYARELVGPILAVIRDRAHPVPLRVNLVAMIGTPRFRGAGHVIDELIACLSPADAVQVAHATLEALGTIGDRATADRLESAVFLFKDAARRGQVLDVVIQLAGDEANVSLSRIFFGAPDDGGRALVLARFQPHDPDSALAVFEQVPSLNQPVRLAGAHRVGEFRTDPFLALVSAWIAVETDEAVLAALGAAKKAQTTIPAYHFLQTVGPANVPDASRDSPQAWAPAQADSGAEWLEVTFDPPLRANHVRIHEVCSAGAVVAVRGTDTAGKVLTLWQGDDPLTRPGVLELSFPVTDRPIRSVRVVLDTQRRSGWNEIDAVELSGPSGSAYASGARASSYYGQGQGRHLGLQSQLSLEASLKYLQSQGLKQR
jgi:hypothetical protein